MLQLVRHNSLACCLLHSAAEGLPLELDLVLHLCATLGLLRDEVLALAGLGLGLGPHDAASPADACAVVVCLPHALNELGELTLVLVLHASDGQSCGCLLVNHRSETCLALPRSRFSQRREQYHYGATCC